MTSSEVDALVETELSRIADEALADSIRALRVTPYSVKRGWDYGSTGESYECWTVLEHPASNTGIAYCLQGFGPSDPWGLVFLSGEYMSIGMDANWYAVLEDAFRESMAWNGTAPEDYEVR